jgi:hypothetical protein
MRPRAAGEVPGPAPRRGRARARRCARFLIAAAVGAGVIVTQITSLTRG